jgi:hypothetical protein
MIFRPFQALNHNLLRWIFVLFLLAFCGGAQAQNVILHLRNGDRIAGRFLYQANGEVAISTVWAKELKIPVSEIERQEIVPLDFAQPPLVIKKTEVTNIVTVTNTITVTNLAQATNAAVATNTMLASESFSSTNKITNVVTRSKSTNMVEAIKSGGKLLADTNSWLKRWKGDIALGMELERGASDHDLYYGRAKLTYSQPYAGDPKEFFRNLFTYDAEYGKTDGTYSDNRMSGSSKTDFDLNRKYYVYNLAAVGYDHVRQINLHYEEGPGAGYHWINRTNLAVNLELGGNYQADEDYYDARSYSFYYRLGQDLTWKLNKQWSVIEKYEFFPRADNPEQFRMRFETTLSCALLLNMSWNFSLVDFYDTEPAVSVPNNDFQLRSSIGIKF